MGIVWAVGVHRTTDHITGGKKRERERERERERGGKFENVGYSE